MIVQAVSIATITIVSCYLSTCMGICLIVFLMLSSLAYISSSSTYASRWLCSPANAFTSQCFLWLCSPANAFTSQCVMLSSLCMHKQFKYLCFQVAVASANAFTSQHFLWLCSPANTFRWLCAGAVPPANASCGYASLPTLSMLSGGCVLAQAHKVEYQDDVRVSKEKEKRGKKGGNRKWESGLS